jgi:uncharacterized protein YigA (DUF484 family)
MTQRLKNSKRPAGATAAQVVEFLRDNPDFFIKHPESLESMQTPDRDLGDGVVDFQQAMIDRLRGEVGDLSGQQRDLVTTTRANLQSQGRVHECILALLVVKSFEELIQTVTTDIAVILDLDVVTLCIEATDLNDPSIHKKGLIVVPAGTMDAVMDTDRRLALRGDIVGDPELFGPGAALVRSDALVRLTISSVTPPALLCFGSRDPDRFDSGQATELLDFLASVLEHVVRIWLYLPED